MTPLLCFSVFTASDSQRQFAMFCKDSFMQYSCTYRFEQAEHTKGIIQTLWFDPYENKYFFVRLPIESNEAAIIDITLRMREIPIVRKTSYSKSSLIKIENIKELGSKLPVGMLCEQWLSQKKLLLQHCSPKTSSLEIEEYNKYINGLLLQYTYRYVVKSGQGILDISYDNYESIRDLTISEVLYDATYDKLCNGNLMKYHEAGKPKKLALKWHVKKSDYSAYFWFEEEDICSIFNKFYGQHPDTKTDFIIHIDPISKKYELSLYRYGLKQPVIIPESAYQLIVFKSGFENYRSENYNQPKGAWIW